MHFSSRRVIVSLSACRLTRYALRHIPSVLCSRCQFSYIFSVLNCHFSRYFQGLTRFPKCKNRLLSTLLDCSLSPPVSPVTPAGLYYFRNFFRAIACTTALQRYAQKFCARSLRARLFRLLWVKDVFSYFQRADGFERVFPLVQGAKLFFRRLTALASFTRL